MADPETTVRLPLVVLLVGLPALCVHAEQPSLEPVDKVPPQIVAARKQISVIANAILQSASYTATYVQISSAELRTEGGADVFIPGDKTPDLSAVALPVPRISRGNLSVRRDGDRSLIEVNPTEPAKEDAASFHGTAMRAVYAKSGETATFYRPEMKRAIVGPAHGLNAVWYEPPGLFLIEHVFKHDLSPDWYRVYGHMSTEDAERNAQRYNMAIATVQSQEQDVAARVIETKEELVIDHLRVRDKPLRISRNILHEKECEWLPARISGGSTADSLAVETTLTWRQIKRAGQMIWFPVSVEYRGFAIAHDGERSLLQVQRIDVAPESIRFNEPLTDEQVNAAIPPDVERVFRQNKR